MEERGYTVLRALGQGGQGRVYEVQNRQGTVCVIKQLPLVGDRDRENAMQEVRLLSSLRHPCIVQYLDSFTSRSVASMPVDDVLCIVMHRCEHDLRKECIMRQTHGLMIEEHQILSWFTQLCWGLNHLHARRFLHRDLKSQNVLLSKFDGPITERLLLADFGMAGHLEHSEDFRKTVVGTPSFMSPEMLEGRPYGCKTDQWALGCVVWEMMTFRAPFADSESYAAVVHAVLHSGPLRSPSGYSLQLSATLESLLARRPDERPACADLLSGSLLRATFQEILRIFAHRVQEKNVALVTTHISRGGSPEPHDENYESDFESYSGSEDDMNNELSPCVLSAAGSVTLGGWGRVFAEAEALLEPHSPMDAPKRMTKAHATLCDLLGSQEKVDLGISFLRERKPLGDTDEADELVLQIEIVDVLGEQGVHALPLLERYLILESQSF